MDLSSLPNYPRANPPQSQSATGEELVASGRWGTMFLQLVLMVGVWAGIYVLNQQSRNISAGFARDEIKRKQAEEWAKAHEALQGKWQSTHGDGTILEVRQGKLTLTRDGQTIVDGEYDRFEDKIFRRGFVEPVDVRYSFRFRVSGQELVVWGDDVFFWVVRVQAPQIDKSRRLEVRFTRIGE